MNTTLHDYRELLLGRIRDSVPEPKLYDLGCGQDPQPGFMGIDLAPSDGGIAMDLFRFSWPIESASVDYFRASHFLEHVPDWNGHFSEVYRCLKPGGYYEIISPYYLNNRWLQDPDHKQPILYDRFAYLSKPWREREKQDHRADLAPVDFSIVGHFELLHRDFRDGKVTPEELEWHKTHSWNVIDDLAMVLRKESM